MQCAPQFGGECIGDWDAIAVQVAVAEYPVRGVIERLGTMDLIQEVFRVFAALDVVIEDLRRKPIGFLLC